MVLDIRLKKLASGLSARAAADAYAMSQADSKKLRDDERAQAAEFEATIEAMFLMAAVDGDVTEAELGQLIASVQAIVDMSGARQAKIDSLIGLSMCTLQRKGGRLASTRSRRASTHPNPGRSRSDWPRASRLSTITSPTRRPQRSTRSLRHLRSRQKSRRKS